MIIQKKAIYDSNPAKDIELYQRDQEVNELLQEVELEQDSRLHLDSSSAESNRSDQLTKPRILKLIDPSIVQLLLSHSQFKQLQEGETLYHAGEQVGNRCFILLAGQIVLKFKTPDGRYSLGFVQGGDFLGEEAYFEAANVLR